MQINYEELGEKLEGLSGLDYRNARKNFMAKNKDFVGLLNINSDFQIEIAAIALGENANDLTNLPLKKYVRLCNFVQRFLLNNSDEEETAAS